MRLPDKDIIATSAVGAAVVLYLLWVADATLPGMSTVRATALVVLALGFVASAIAVVPGFDRLLHGNKAYLTATSLIGLTALVAGVVALWSPSGTALAVLMATVVVLWLMATTHHALLSRSARSAPHEEAPATQRDHVGVG
jgi:asparagine N-glycosylation enzyme membrane subunit Stt3